MRAPSIAALAAALLSVPVSARADTTATSSIAQIKVLEKNDANYKLYHGAIWLEYDKATYNYRWGGAHCGEQGLSDINLGLLFAAFRAKYSVTIDYAEVEYKERSYRCITAFSVTR
ncbi:MAG TPA: hypothetical protein VL172_08585 [Kofleriaceae bacterium]|nr:hypothetical protein [Kofleriaceae bacterium]